jgi:CubicO group peptidase (beta-lactamase class C family)
VWSKLGAEHNASIVCDVQGAATPWGGMSTTLRDLARWGQMHLEGGTFRGRQILPEWFIPDVRQHADPGKVTKDSGLLAKFLTPGWSYRSQYFRPEGPDGPIYTAGAAGQYCFIHPDCEVVITKFSTHGGIDPELGRLEIHALRQIAESVAL